MPGRGDNNKKGSSGRGAGNQSNQGFGQASRSEKSYHGEHTGGKPSQQQEKVTEQDSSRDSSVKRERK